MMKQQKQPEIKQPEEIDEEMYSNNEFNKDEVPGSFKVEEVEQSVEEVKAE